MNLNFKTIIAPLKELLSKENLEKIGRFIRDEGEKITTLLENASPASDNPAEILCETIEGIKELDMDTLKVILKQTMPNDAEFAAALNLGRNKEDRLELFIQYLNADEKPLDADKLYCIRSKSMSDELENTFGGKEMLLIKL